MTKECAICGKPTGNWIGFCPEHDPAMSILSRDEIEALIDRTYDVMSDPDSDPEEADAACEDHVRYIKMLEDLDK